MRHSDMSLARIARPVADVRHITLSPTPSPKSWQDALKLRGLFCLNAFAVDDTTELIISADPGRTPEVAEIFPDAAFHPIAGGARVVLPRTDSVKVTFGPASLDIPVQAPETFADGCNSLLAITTVVNPDHIEDWLTYHRRHHSADCAVIFLRMPPDGMPDGFLDRLAGFTFPKILIVTSDQPLGLPGQGAESDRWFVPGAPGKSTLEPPEPDPWRSPLMEVAVLEVLHRRILRHARAVLRCDPSDLVAPSDQSVFDLVQTGSGFLRFRGTRAFPFGTATDDTFRHGDHNCRAFDGGRAENIWCVAPTRLEDGQFWRQFRIASAEPDPTGAELGYWRCMALRHPGLKTAEIVPKSSLVLDPDLDQLMRREFGTDPKVPPPPPPKPVLKNDVILAVSTMKNEGPFIIDWLAWHRSIGVTDFLIYTNDCTDGTDELLDLLAARGRLEHRDNPYRDTGERPQHAAYRAAQDTEAAGKADWIVCMDVDEYINIHAGDGTMAALFAAVPDATMISMTWRLFGNGDIGPFADAPITRQFTRCAPLLTRKPHQAWGFKTLFRNLGHYKKFGVHRPKGLRPEHLGHINYVNGSGQPMPGKMLRSGWRSSMSTIGYELVTLNHYALRSAESFLVKRDRGRVNHVDRDQGLNYWFRMNHNAQEDRSILKHDARFMAERARLLADPAIAQAHAACVAAHQTRIRDLMARPDYQALYDTITGDRLRALSRLLHHFGTAVFEAGPDAVPPDFHLTHGPR